MCLYPRTLDNKKYQPNKKNGGKVPFPPVIGEDELGFGLFDTRVLKVQVPCGHCIECCEQKASGWRIRMTEELKEHNYNYFITLTFSNEELNKLKKEFKLPECNAVAAKAVRRHLERWRKDNKCQLKHWYITELGHENTERIHLHGIIFSDVDLQDQFEKVERQKDGYMCKWKYWKYGHIWLGDYCTNKTINYIVKYITKLDTDHKGFYGQVLCSPGIGRNFSESVIFNKYRYMKRKSITTYTNSDGTLSKNPVYYKNKAYNEEERENIWRDSMDEGCTFIMGNKYYTRNVEPRVLGRVLDKAREINKQFGYGDNSKEWQKKKFNITEKMIQRAEQEEEARKEMEEAIKKLKEMQEL